jgi:hypothetical protein
MVATGDRVFETVPRADDVEVILVEHLTQADLVFTEPFPNPRDQKALTNRAAQVRAAVEIRVELAGETEDPDRPVADIDHQASALGYILAVADLDANR